MLETDATTVAKTPQRPVVLVVAGSDSGGGAGIQADIRAITALGGHPVTAVTALTAQDSRGVHAVQPTDPEVLRAQLRVLLEDYPVAAIKTGMLADTTVLGIVLEALARVPALPLVVDPVMVATTGARLLAPEAITLLREALWPRATVITPNWPEALVLADLPADARLRPRELLDRLRERYGVPVLLKGGHAETAGDRLTDWLDTGEARRAFRSRRLPIRPHGTGCSLASAIAAGLAAGLSLESAVSTALQALRQALAHGQTLGQGGLTIPDFHWRVKPVRGR